MFDKQTTTLTYVQLNIPGLEFAENLLVVRHVGHLECFQHEDSPLLAGRFRHYADEFHRDHSAPSAGTWVSGCRLRWLSAGLYVFNVFRCMDEPFPFSYTRLNSKQQVLVSNLCRC